MDWTGESKHLTEPKTILERITAGTYSIAAHCPPEQLDEVCNTVVSLDGTPTKIIELIRCPSPGIFEIVVACSPDGSPMPPMGDEVFPDHRLLDGKKVRVEIHRFKTQQDFDFCTWNVPVTVYFEPSPTPEVFGRQVIRVQT